ncbi:MAG: PAS domain S-box protein [Myxococcales bacterium]
MEVNDRFCEITGYPRAELLQMGPADLSPPEDARRDRALLDAALREDRPTYELTKRYRRKDGRVIWVQVSAAMVRDAGGRPVRAAGLVQDITAQKESALELARARDRLERAQAAARIGTFEWDPTDPDRLFTSGMEVVYGEEKGSLGGRYASWTRRLHPEDLPRVEAHLADVAAGRCPYDVEFRVCWPDGSVHWVAALGRLERDAQGRAVGLTGVNLDITDRKRAEEELRESQARLRMVLENSLDAAYRRDLQQGRFDYLSPVIESVSGFTAAEMCAMSHEEGLGRVHPEDLPRLQAALAEAERTGTLSVEYRFRTKRGEYCWLADRAVMVRDERGRLRYRTGFVRDVSEARLADLELQERERRFRTLFETSPAGIVVLALDGRIVDFNERAHLQLGYSREEFARLSVREIEAKEDPAAVAAHLASIDATGAAFFETRQKAKSGEVRDVLVDVRTIEVGGQRRILAVCRDITDSKRAEQALQDADRNKNQFMAMLSHELRNPLAPIRNSLYVLDRAPAGSDQAARAKAVIQRQVVHLSRLVDDLLDVTRITRGKIRLQRELLDLGEVVRKTVEDLRPGFEAAQIGLELAAGPAPVPVVGDRTRLAQALGNLLHNALKFTERGGKVAVRLEQDLGRGEAVLTVADDGAGISAEMLPRLFQPFTQAEDTLDRTRGGLGLGLSLVKGLSELHGGSVAARSAGLGHGSQFTVRLPLDRGLARGAGPAQGAPPARRRVLVIEDNVDAAQSLRDVLELGGHEVAVAHNGPVGIAQARACRPDVVLCDIGLPGLDGYGVARTLRADPELRGTTLVALSGYAMPEDLQRAAEAGFRAHLAKPPSLEQLEQVLSSVPAAPRAARASGVGESAVPGV